MKNIDYIIVGGGYAGLFFAHQLLKNNKTFVLYHNMQESASHISAGVCNPVILKRFSTFWNSGVQMDYLPEIFSEIEGYTGRNYLVDEPVARIFHNEYERRDWIKSSTKEHLKDYLNTDFVKLKSVQNIFDSGVVNDSCRIDVNAFFTDFLHYLDSHDLLIKEDFRYDLLDPNSSVYSNYKFEKIVFCEGIHVDKNTFFPLLPVVSNKGHFIEIETNVDPEPYIIKKKHFFISQGYNKFYCGGTYDRNDKNSDVNQESITELKDGIEEIYKGDYKITDIKVGFRATVEDRKPILGAHKDFQNLFVFNGLGARGVLNGSYFSKVLFEHIELQYELDLEINISRFY